MQSNAIWGEKRNFPADCHHHQRPRENSYSNSVPTIKRERVTNWLGVGQGGWCVCRRLFHLSDGRSVVDNFRGMAQDERFPGWMLMVVVTIKSELLKFWSKLFQLKSYYNANRDWVLRSCAPQISDIHQFYTRNVESQNNLDDMDFIMSSISSSRADHLGSWRTYNKMLGLVSAVSITLGTMATTSLFVMNRGKHVVPFELH